MIVDLEILFDAVSKPLHRNVYELSVEYMHGDADTYTTEAAIYKEKAHLISHLHGVARLEKIAIQDFSVYQDKAETEELIRNYLTELGQPADEIENFIDKFVPYDCMDKSAESCAKANTIHVFWYDENGYKYPVRRIYEN